jgi:hypothetical protein
MVISTASEPLSMWFSGEIHHRAAPTAICSSVVIANAAGDMWSKRV